MVFGLCAKSRYHRHIVKRYYFPAQRWHLFPFECGYQNTRSTILGSILRFRAGTCICKMRASNQILNNKPSEQSNDPYRSDFSKYLLCAILYERTSLSLRSLRIDTSCIYAHAGRISFLHLEILCQLEHNWKKERRTSEYRRNHMRVISSACNFESIYVYWIALRVKLQWHLRSLWFQTISIE